MAIILNTVHCGEGESFNTNDVSGGSNDGEDDGPLLGIRTCSLTSHVAPSYRHTLNNPGNPYLQRLGVVPGP